MKLRFVIAPMLFLASLLLAQTVVPTNLTILAVPGYSSSPQGIVFTNTGGSEITLTISITGPFSIPTNRCGRGVKPGTHCNLYVQYTPKGIETDSGTLTFAFDGQTVSVPLTGEGVSSVPTGFSHVGFNNPNVNVTMVAEGDVIPNNEPVWLYCMNYIGTQTIYLSTPLTNNKGSFEFGETGQDWQCDVAYQGDAEFAASETGPFWINQCHPVWYCHDNSPPAPFKKKED